MENLKDISVLDVDDEIHNLNSFRAAFRRDFNVLTVISAEEGLQIMKVNVVHVVIADQRMPAMSGFDFLEKIMRRYSEVLRVLLTGFEDIHLIIDALHRKVVHCSMDKPWDEDQIRIVVNTVHKIPSYKSAH